MVRLKGCRKILIVADKILFQFHNGSIKGIQPKKDWQGEQRFQFHNGSIKGNKPFNPKHDKSGFQFHNGSIKGIRSL